MNGATCKTACCGSSGSGRFGEEFWNCADVAVLAAGDKPPVTSAPETDPATQPPPLTDPATQPPVTSPPATDPATTPAKTTTAEATSEPESEPENHDEASDDCAAVWEQCGGTNWNGKTCCQPGHSCNVVSEWYHQCQSGSAALASVGQKRKVQKHRFLASSSATALVQEWKKSIHARLTDETEL